MPDPYTVAGLFTRPQYTVATLPPAGVFVGAIRYVTDSTLNPATSSGAIAVGGGTTRCRVLSDSSNWRIYGWSG